MKIRFVFSDPDILGEAREILEPAGLEVVPCELQIEALRSEDMHSVVADKLLSAFRLIGKPVCVEHTGLFIGSLNDFPAGLTNVFWDRLLGDRFSRIIGHLDDPSAVARTLIGYCDGRKKYFFEGAVEGRIADHPAGDAAFGWDCVFIPEGQTRTFAELGPDKHRWSMRRRALDAFVAFLREH
jgi:XTP/dITP diphosphohydrolase